MCCGNCPGPSGSKASAVDLLRLQVQDAFGLNPNACFQIPVSSLDRFGRRGAKEAGPIRVLSSYDSAGRAPGPAHCVPA